MKQEEFDAWITEHYQNAHLLSQSNAVHQISPWMNNSDRSFTIASCLISKAQSLNVPVALAHTENAPQNGRLPLLHYFLMESDYKKGFRHALRAGLNLWLKSLNLKDGQVTATWEDAEKVIYHIFPQAEDRKKTLVSSQQNYLKAALAPLDNMPESTAIHCFEKILSRYEQSLEGITVNRPGILGIEDQNALINSRLLIEFEEDFKKVAASLGQGSRPLQALINTAKNLVTIKESPALEAFDPEALKKQLSDKQLTRIRTLGFVQNECEQDDEALSLLIEGSRWIESMPQVLAIPFKGKSFIHYAILTHSEIAINWIEKVGANIWLASAQAGVENAAEWCITSQVKFRDASAKRETKIMENLGQWGRILAYGAHLNGIENPIEWTLQKVEEAHQKIIANNRLKTFEEGAASRYIEALKAHIEGIVLKELIKNNQQTQGAEHQEHPAPKKRISRL